MFSFECESHEKNILVFFVGQINTKTRSSLSSYIQDAYDENLIPDLTMFLYPEYLKDEVDNLISDEVLAIDVARQKKSSLCLVSFSIQGDISFKKTSQMKCFENSKLAKDVIKYGFKKLMEMNKNEVIVTAPSGTVFVKPSGKELEEFIYASQLARTNFENQFLAFSMLHHGPKINTVDCIYIDTASISAIAESTIYYISKFEGNDCKRINYKSFSSYSGLDKNKPDDEEGAWVIISASATRSMGKKIVTQWNVKPDQVITILSYEKPLEPTDKNIGNSVVFSVDEYSTKNSKARSPVKVQIQGESFSAEMAIPSKILVKLKHKPKSIEKSVYPYATGDIFTSNRRGKTIYFDYSKFREKHFPKIESNDSYVNWIEQVVNWCVPMRLSAIVAEKNNNNDLLVDDFKNVLLSIGFDVDNIDVYTPEALCELSEISEGAILILSAAVGSGRGFIDINRSLRISKHSGMRVFATPFTISSTEENYERFTDSLCQAPKSFRYIFKSFHTIFIGDQSSTVWKNEIQAIKDIIKLAEGQLLDTTYWNARLSLLEKEGDGLSGRIGIHGADPNRALTFSKDFAYWNNTYNLNDLNHEAVYATVASILQNLRGSNINGDTLKSNVYKHSVLDPENFVRYNDPLLQSCLWRAATPQELDYRRSDEFSEDIEKIFSKIIVKQDSERGSVALDLLIAIASGWMKLSTSSLKRLINKASQLLVKTESQQILDLIKKQHKIQ